jgi:hypothetical protein
MANVEFYRIYHREHAEYGRTSGGEVDYVLAAVGEARPRSVLDFGAGKSALADSLAAHWGATATRYDPAIPEIATPPEGLFDLGLCTDVLEHVPEAELDAFLATLRAHAALSYIRVSTIPATKLLPNGENAHCTVRPADWWRDRLLAHWPEVERLPPVKVEFCRFVTWRPSPATVEAVREVRKTEQRRKKLVRLRRRIATPVRLALNFLRGRTWTRGRLLEELAGKRVALVGNAESLSARAQGAAIDAADLVIRFNRAPIIRPSSHGRRTDWIATGHQNLKPGFLNERGVALVIWTGVHIKDMPRTISFGEKAVHLISEAARSRLRRMLGRDPSSGMMMIDLVAESEAAAIDLYGFDFARTSSLSGHREADAQPHDFAAEGRHVAALMARDPRIALR